MTDLRQQLIRSLAEDGVAPRAVQFDPDERAFEAFRLGQSETYLLDPLKAASVNEALAEATSRWAWDRGDRLAVREMGRGCDRLHIYAVRRKSEPIRTWRGHLPITEHKRWLDHICTVDIDVLVGFARHAVGTEIRLHEHRQAQRPEGARLSR